MSIVITGTGSYLPARIMTNYEIEKNCNTSNKWIKDKLGILTRRIASDTELTSDLAYLASMNAIKSAGISVSDIDGIIVATSTPDRPSPATACILQDKLGCHGCFAFDINAVCTGFIYALSVAESMLRNDSFNRILVVGAEVYSRITDWDSRDCVYFGDGAGAVIVEKSKDGFFDFDLGADGKGKDYFTVPAGGSQFPSSKETIDNKMHYFRMIGKEIFDFATEKLPISIGNILLRNNLKPENVSLMVPHQPNINILKIVSKKTNIPVDKVQICLDKIGNTAGASVPIALDWAVKSGKISNNDIIVMTAVGSGMTWGSAIIRWKS